MTSPAVLFSVAEPLVAKAGDDLELKNDRAILLGDDGYLHYYALEGYTAEQCIEPLEEFLSVTNVRVLAADGAVSVLRCGQLARR